MFDIQNNILPFSRSTQYFIALTCQEHEMIYTERKKCIVKPVLRGHLGDKEKWPYKTGDLLKEVYLI
jgi:hypothetical protein